MMTEPRSIWYVDAEVSVRPTYMIPVPAMSQNAGSAKMCFGTDGRCGSLAWPRRRRLKSISSSYQPRHMSSPRNMAPAMTNGWSNSSPSLTVEKVAFATSVFAVPAISMPMASSTCEVRSRTSAASAAVNLSSCTPEG